MDKSSYTSMIVTATSIRSEHYEDKAWTYQQQDEFFKQIDYTLECEAKVKAVTNGTFKISDKNYRMLKESDLTSGLIFYFEDRDKLGVNELDFFNEDTGLWHWTESEETRDIAEFTFVATTEDMIDWDCYYVEVI